MYKTHFGFREKPFQLVPNPAYLFLSKSHEEALAHLNYAVSQGDGFVQITGEVGTGKTTLCRAFIEGLDPDIEVAYLFNPTLNAVELLEALHDEWAIPYEKGASPKRLIDSLNGFLMKKKARGQKVLLVIDEAQHLKGEVLEQIRLLSNLETHTEKLLQIILVGQPELADMMSSYALRQLGQRITLCASLRPLSFRDTVRFIQHRLHIAGPGARVDFTRSAYRKIFRYAKGIPRLIHIVCDRALLVAYVLEKDRITGPIVRTAIRELTGSRKNTALGRPGARAAAVLAAVLCVALAGFAGWRTAGFHASPPQGRPSLPPSPTPGLPAVESPSPMLPYAGREDALGRALSLWERPVIISDRARALRDDADFFQSAAEDNGFQLYRVEGDFSLIEKLNLPAILGFYVPEANAVRYLVLEHMEGDTMTFLDAEAKDKAVMKRKSAVARWSGVAYIPWINFLDCRGTLPIAGPKQSVLVLKQLLRQIGFEGIGPGSDYDAAVQGAVKKIQGKYGLEEDGLVGSLTKILLYNERGTFDIPHLKGGGKG
jgi:general secretion pathway protein A